MPKHIESVLIAIAILGIAVQVWALEAGMPTGPFESFSDAAVARQVFGIPPGGGEARVLWARHWDADGAPRLAVIAETGSGEDGMCEDCRRLVRLAVFARDGDRLREIASAELENVGNIAKPFLAVEDQGLSIDDSGGFPFAAGETLLPIVHEWKEAGGNRITVTLFRLANSTLVPVFERVILDDPADFDPDSESMEAWVEAGDVPGGANTYARIEVSEGYFSQFAGEKVELDGQRVEVWEFDGARYAMRNCEETGGAGTTD
ncbi:MAG: hypothetical protein V3S44_04145, partial [Alphaproteobacteria bacterium]